MFKNINNPVLKEAFTLLAYLSHLLVIRSLFIYILRLAKFVTNISKYNQNYLISWRIFRWDIHIQIFSKNRNILDSRILANTMDDEIIFLNVKKFHTFHTFSFLILMHKTNQCIGLNKVLANQRKNKISF